MFHVLINGEKVPVPREVEAQGPKAVQGFIDGQKARLESEAKEGPVEIPAEATLPTAKRRSRGEGTD